MLPGREKSLENVYSLGAAASIRFVEKASKKRRPPERTGTAAFMFILSGEIGIGHIHFQ